MSDNFNDAVNHKFVGQEIAVRMIRNHLIDHDAYNERPLVLHFVGPSGTGKSKMAEIIARSKFDDCASRGSSKNALEKTLYAFQTLSEGLSMIPLGFLNNIVNRVDSVEMWRSKFDFSRCKETFEHWHFACGIVRFNYRTIATRNQNIFDEIAEEIHFQPHSVIIFDDFNYCDKDCAEKLKELLTDRVVRRKSGELISLNRATIILCSDLTDVGLFLNPLETYEQALEHVLQVANDFWGRNSIIMSQAITVPFSPMSDDDMREIFRIINNEIGEYLKKRIDRYMEKLSDSTNQQHTWKGRFHCAESEKNKFLDILQRDLHDKNGRAVSETYYNEVMKKFSNPLPIEKRLAAKTVAPDGAVSFTDDVTVTLDASDRTVFQIVINVQ